MASEAPHRRLSTFTTLAVLIGLLVVGAYLGFRALFAPVEDDSVVAVSPTCQPEQIEPGERLSSKEVTVSVYNAGNRAGLAGATMDDLTARGFKAGQVGNAPTDVDVDGLQVWSTDADDPAARLVARQFGSKVKVRVGEDLGPGVEVLVGSKFKGLVKAPRTITVKQPQKTCVEE